MCNYHYISKEYIIFVTVLTVIMNTFLTVLCLTALVVSMVFIGNKMQYITSVYALLYA